MAFSHSHATILQPTINKPHFVVNGILDDASGVRKSLYTPGQKKIAETVRDMRAEAGLTQRQFAARLKRPLNVISRIESAQRRVDFLEWIALCEACDVDPVERGYKLLSSLVRIG